MKKVVQILTVAILLFQGKVIAQNNSSTPQKWGIETELVQPFLPTVGIVRLQGSYTVTAPEKRQGDLLFGAYIRPNTKHDVVEKINEYMVILGYRQYFWKGLHVEAKANIGYAWGTKNLIDGKDYETATLFWETNVGYKFKLTNKTTNSLYVIPQFGVLGNARGPSTVNIGPRGGKPDTFIQGGLTIGINF
ncbi:MAG: hypothetical protein RL757_2786 [Bacteroidota bacterium]|jgi:hypothetical protein